MPRQRNQLVAELMRFGFSRRDAFRVAKIQQHPIPWQLYTEGLLSTAEAARLVKVWPYHGEQAIMACHVMQGWKLKDSETHYLIAIQIVVKEALDLDWDMSDSELQSYIEKNLIMPMRANLGIIPDQYRTPKNKVSNRATRHDSATPDIAEAVAEIQRLRSKLHDLGVDPDS